MKRFSILRSIGLCAVGALIISCATETEVVKQYVSLSQVYYSFLYEGGSSEEIKVKASPGEWEAKCDAGWLKVERSPEGGLVITADENDSHEERITVVRIQAGEAVNEIKVNQLGAESSFARFRMADKFQMGGAVSPSGKYVGGFITTIAADDSYQFQPTIIDTETGETVQYGPISSSVHYLHQTMCISDQGTLFMVDGQNGGTVVCTIDGDVYKVPTPEGFQFQPTVQGTSADGKYWVGFCVDHPILGPEGGLTRPILWTDGNPEALPIPELNYRDEEVWSGVMARGISANGKIIYGTSWENNDYGMCYWEGENHEFHWVGEDVREVWPVVMEMPDGETYDANLCNGMICQSELTKISPSGKWIATSYRTETLATNKRAVVYEQYPAFYNTETKTSIILKDYPTSTGAHVTDDGIAFIGIGNYGISSGRVYDLNAGLDLGTTEEWVLNTYGIHISSGYINYVSADGKVLFGTCMQSSAMGVAFVNWYVAPPLAE